ncbi:MAG: hypothetical protein Q8P56_05530 [Candidatus Uhrbacteria bacterium]|nr:hypothetical protein [Candidatus Uhrbacteria bacterium]
MDKPKIPERHEYNVPSYIRSEAVRAYAAAFVALFSQIATDPAEARIECQSVTPETNSMQLKYEQGNAVNYISIGNIVLLGLFSGETSLEMKSLLFQKIKEKNIQVRGVSYTVEENARLERFLFAAVDRLRKEELMPMRRVKMFEPAQEVSIDQWDIADLIEAAAKIIRSNYDYDDTLRPYIDGKDNPDFDKKKFDAVNSRPLDRFKKGDGIVCRHAGALMELYVNTLARMSGSPKLKHNFYIDELESNTDNHAWNVVYVLELFPDDYAKRWGFGEGGVPVLKMGFVDLSRAILKMRVEDVDITRIEARDYRYSSIKESMYGHVFPGLDSQEQRALLQCLFEMLERNIPDATLLQAIIVSYKEDILFLEKKGEPKKVEERKREAKQFLERVKRVLDVFESRGLSKYISRVQEPLYRQDDAKRALEVCRNIVQMTEKELEK